MIINNNLIILFTENRPYARHWLEQQGYHLLSAGFDFRIPGKADGKTVLLRSEIDHIRGYRPCELWMFRVETPRIREELAAMFHFGTGTKVVEVKE